ETRGIGIRAYKSRRAEERMFENPFHLMVSRLLTPSCLWDLCSVFDKDVPVSVAKVMFALLFGRDSPLPSVPEQQVGFGLGCKMGRSWSRRRHLAAYSSPQRADGGEIGGRKFKWNISISPPCWAPRGLGPDVIFPLHRSLNKSSS